MPVHRRLRPEAFGGLVHNVLAGDASYPIDAERLNSAATSAVFSKHGSCLLPQAYPEGSTLHSTYGGGHAAMAGAYVTILKAWFDESFVIPDPVVPNSGGTILVAYSGPDAGSLTVGGELNKVAANIATGRSFAGIRWRTDYSQSLKLGEAVAIGIIEEQQATYNESGSFTPPPIRCMGSGHRALAPRASPGAAGAHPGHRGPAWTCPYFQCGHAWFEW